MVKKKLFILYIENILTSWYHTMWKISGIQIEHTKIIREVPINFFPTAFFTEVRAHNGRPRTKVIKVIKGTLDRHR